MLDRLPALTAFRPRQVGDNIFIVEERVRRLAERLKKWVHLRRTPPKVGVERGQCYTVAVGLVRRPVNIAERGRHEDALDCNMLC